MGDIIPREQEMKEGDIISGASWGKLSDVYLQKDSGRTEQLNTANAVIASGLLMLTEKRPDLVSYQECEQAIYNYFRICAERNVRPSISGIAIAFGLTRRQFLEACDSGLVEIRHAPAPIALPNEVWNLFLNLKENYAAMLESFLESNVIHPSAATFLLKNNCGYKDEVSHSYNVTKTVIDVSSFAEKYKQELDGL